MKKILFVSHDDSLSGAPVALLNLLQLIATMPQVAISVIILYKRGGIKPDLDKLSKEIIYNRQFRIAYPAFERFPGVRRILQPFINFSLKRKAAKINRKYDAVFYNSFVSGNSCRELLPYIKIPQHMYVHELKNAIHAINGSNYTFLEQMSAIYAPSAQAVKNIMEHVQDTDKVFQLPLFLREEQVIHKIERQTAAGEKFRIGNMGNIGWAKGFDYFLAISRLYRSRYPQDKVLFEWKGFTKDSFEWNLAHTEISNAGLVGYIELLPRGPENTAFYSELDLFIITSKEETFSLVMLEAATAGIPVIAFRKAGGMGEFIGRYNGCLVDYLDIGSFADAIKDFYDHPARRSGEGEKAKAAAFENYVLNDHVRHSILSTLQSSGLL